MPRGQKPKQYDHVLVATVARLYGEGKTQAEVASELGLTQKVVFNVMRRHGIAARVAAKRDQSREKNASWKGQDAGKHALHRRLYAMHGKPGQCSVCGTTTAKAFDYANLSGQYVDPADYAPMCRSCHATYDNKISNILNNRRDAGCAS